MRTCSICIAILLALYSEGSVPEFSLHRAAEQMVRFDPVAARLALEDMKRDSRYDYSRWAPAVEALIAQEASVRKALGVPERPGASGGGRLSPKEAAGIVERWRQAMLANPVLDFEEILCVRRKTEKPREEFCGQEVGYRRFNYYNHLDMRREGYTNEIVAISGWKTGYGRFRTIYSPPAGRTPLVRDLDLDFDALRLLFTMDRGTNRLWGVFETVLGGNGEAVLVSPPEEPDVQWWNGIYLPNRDQVIILGTTTYQYLPCEDGYMPMNVVYRRDRRTGETRQLTFEQDSDYTPSVTHDGRVLFTRWEYSDLPHYFSRILMTMNPDGVGQLSLWGTGSYVPIFFAHARVVPGEPHLLTFLGGGHHDRAEVGRMFLVDPTLARSYPFRYDPPDRSWGPVAHVLRIPAKTFPKEKTGLVHEFPGRGKDVEGDVSDAYTKNQFARGKPYFSFPYPLSRNYHLATVKIAPDALTGIWLVDTFDNFTLIAEVEDGILVEPMPLKARPRPPIIPDRSVKGMTNCSVHVADIYNGPGLAGVPRGTVKRMRLFSYHFNYHKTGGHSRVGLDRVESGWDVKRILGTVDVEEDGSICFEMPANLPISFQPLDSKGRALQLMRSWVVGMPGERVSCTGCHEDNRSSIQTKQTIADRKYHAGHIQKIKPTDSDGLRPWGFANEVWPVVRKYCLTCHGDAAKAPIRRQDQGGASEKDPSELSGLRLVMASATDAYRMLHPYVRRPGPESDNTILVPLDYHASTSPLMQMLEKGHHGVNIAPKDMEKFYEWADLNTPWSGRWRPRPIGEDKFSNVCTNQVVRRRELAIKYANVADDPEAEFDRYSEIVAKRPVEPVPPRPVPSPEVKDAQPLLPTNVWPMTERSAAALQMGMVDQMAPVTLKRIDIGGGQTMVFRLVPAGSFVMGSETGAPDEKPCAIAKIDSPFWMSETEVRNEQYAVFDPEHDSGYQDQFGKDHVVPGYIGNHARQPVVRVSWREARAFCRWFSAKFGCRADLPTEAQWEWAARAGAETPFPWGGLDDDFSPYANLADADVRNMHVVWNGPGAVRRRRPFKILQNFPLHEERWKDDWFTINYVARALPNVWGLYDMHGNASEWTRSDYVPYPYIDGDGRNDGNIAHRKVVRGGSFASRPRNATSSFRQGYESWQKVYDVGFRIVIDAE